MVAMLIIFLMFFISLFNYEFMMYYHIYLYFVFMLYLLYFIFSFNMKKYSFSFNSLLLYMTLFLTTMLYFWSFSYVGDLKFFDYYKYFNSFLFMVNYFNNN